MQKAEIFESDQCKSNFGRGGQNAAAAAGSIFSVGPLIPSILVWSDEACLNEAKI
jgi:hypothetical protein